MCSQPAGPTTPAKATYGTLIPTDQGNTYSVGVETDHTTGEPWPREQLLALLVGTVAICRYLGTPAAAVIGHKDYAPGRKTDPDGITMTR